MSPHRNTLAGVVARPHIRLYSLLEPHPLVMRRMIYQSCSHRIQSNIFEFLGNPFGPAKHMVERLVLPDAAVAAQRLVDAMSGLAFDFLENVRERNRPIGAGDWSEDEVNVIGHHDEAMECAFCAVEVMAGFGDQIPCALRQMPALVGGKCREDRLLVSLIVRESAAVEIVAKHGAKIVGFIGVVCVE